MLDGDHSRGGGYVGVGRLAEMLAVSPSTVRKWEALGIVPAAGRVAPRSERVWPASDLESIKERVAAKRTAGRPQGDAA